MKLYKAIIKALTGAETGTTEVEEKGRFTVTKAFTCPVQPDKAELIRLAGLLPQRDSVQLSLHQATPICQISDIASGVDDLIEKLNDTIYQGEELTVKLQIDKDTNNGIMSVYDYQKFSDYLAGLNLVDFLNFFSEWFHQGTITFEVFDENQHEWSTGTSLFRSNKSQSQPSAYPAEKRQNILKLREQLCHSEKTFDTIIPQDFIITQGEEANDELQKAFQRVSLIFLMMHLFDYSSLSTEDYRFKLCGYKTHAGIISTKSVKDIKHCFGDNVDLYNIFKWCYEYGQRDEKISIARNVLSLNMSFENDPDGEFSLEKDVYETVKSNYEFFERDHIRQYVELHAKLNETILSLEEKIIGCVNKYISEFKAGLFVIASFLISSFVLRFINKAESLTPTILWISLIIIAIYVISFLYTSWETTKAISNYSDSFDSLKRRYRDILSHKEQIELFGNEEVYEHGKGIAFAEQRVKNYKRAWLTTSGILVVGVILGLLNC